MNVYSSIKHLVIIVLIAGFLLTTKAAATPDSTKITQVSRHPLEIKALTDPKGVLKVLPNKIQNAKASNNHEELALLYLAEANACRVIADWKCQSTSGANARLAAQVAKLPELQVRGLIAESRAIMATQDFTQSEDLLGDAERILESYPIPELSADIYLAYSSLSYTLGKNALAAEYATRGLNVLSQFEALPIRIRLLRNQARALAQLDKTVEAGSILKKALILTESIQDPKLSAELYIEIARIANTRNDIPTQIESGNKILTLSNSLKNSQLTGLGYEVLGLAALNQKDNARAETLLYSAKKTFQSLKLYRDERRVLRSLITSMVGRDKPQIEIENLTKRLVELGWSLESDDRKLAADDFDARLKYAQQKFDVKKLKLNESLNNEREAAEKVERRFITTVAVLSIVLLTILGILSLLQRRNNKQLKLVIAQLHDAERALNASESRMRAITDNIPAIIAQIDKDQRYVFANAYTGKVLGLDPQLLIGKTLREARGEDHYIEVQSYIEDVLQGKRVRFERSSLLAGKPYYYQSNYMPEFDENQNVKGFLALTYDITALKLAEANLDRLTRIDSLTGIANRRHFDEQLATALARSRRQEHGITLLYLDIDNFKIINDNHGHLVGDSVIMAFSERVQSCVREVDLVARLGGDEFVVLIENSLPETGEIIANKLLASMQQVLIINEMTLPLSASIGVAYCCKTPDAKTIMNLADQALYLAKAAGRNTYRVKLS